MPMGTYAVLIRSSAVRLAGKRWFWLLLTNMSLQPAILPHTVLAGHLSCVCVRVWYCEGMKLGAGDVYLVQRCSKMLPTEAASLCWSDKLDIVMLTILHRLGLYVYRRVSVAVHQTPRLPGK